MAVVKEADDSAAGAAAAVIVVHLNELNLECSGSKWRHVGIVIDLDLVVEVNPRDLAVVL
ncbi:hypothetical protein [Micromonospora sp. NBC_00858]|uniref:hypothetical protein n=1 Tax=Micromonospora sp. NBC_00858 TaxID=2975979 RepID=UPI00386A95AC|nr:hypothetical protein OG990_15570 [Micromonospora sp. NBC_00858]